MTPEHYAGDVDPIALMEAQFTPEQLYGFFAGNVIKYVSRAWKNQGVADLKKASDYLERPIALGDVPPRAGISPADLAEVLHAECDRWA